jgi:hypothetical protein
MGKNLETLEAALRAARKAVFSEDPGVADAAAEEIRRIRAAITAHPDEVRRAAAAQAAVDEALLRRWN